MPVEYDVVMIGGTEEGREGAIAAARMGARVALVEPAESTPSLIQSTQVRHGFIQASRIKADSTLAVHLGLATTSPMNAIHWPTLKQWLQTVAELNATQLSPQVLAAQGIDIIQAEGRFRASPNWVFEVAGRQLASRAFLLAMGSTVSIPATFPPESSSHPYLTPDNLSDLEDWPQRLVVLGSTPTAIELAQAFSRLGSQVTLVMSAAYLLPTEEPEVAALLTAQLIADGITLIPHASVGSVQFTRTDVLIQVNGQTLAADRLLLAHPPQTQLDHLGLEGWGVSSSAQSGISVNRQLRTLHPQIYACSALLGGNACGAIARHEIDVALHNALFLPRRSVNYREVPYAFETQPAIARVGLTEARAHHLYRGDITALTLPFHGVHQAQWLNQTTGFCKLVINRQGHILGAHWIGPAAQDMIQAMTLLIKARIPLDRLTQAPPLPNTVSDVLTQAAENWQSHRWHPGTWRRDWAENWFNWRRSSR